MAVYATFTTTRQTPPDPVALLVNVKTATGDGAAVIGQVGSGRYVGKKAAAWTAGDITATQNAIETTAAVTPQLAAQRAVDTLPLEYKALVLALIDQFNTLRALHSLPAITPAQALAAIRTKAGTL